MKHAQDLAEQFLARGVKAEAVWGEDPEREIKLARHKNGETTVLCNCSVLTEGYDDKTIRCIVMARPIQSTLMYTQMIGRGLRPDTESGKKDCLLIDCYDNCTKHSLIGPASLVGLPNVDMQGACLTAAAKLAEQVEPSKKLTGTTLENLRYEEVDPLRKGAFTPLAEISKFAWLALSKDVYVLPIAVKRPEPSSYVFKRFKDIQDHKAHMQVRRDDGTWYAWYLREDPKVSGVNPVDKPHLIGHFADRDSAVRAADNYLFERAEKKLRPRERERLMTSVSLDRKWRKERPSAEQIKQVKNRTGREPSSESTKGDITAFLTIEFHGRDYDKVGRNLCPDDVGGSSPARNGETAVQMER